MINSLRLEKGYRAWGADISPDDTALEAGLGFALAWKKPVPFLGKDAILRQKEAGLKRLLVTFVLEDPEHNAVGPFPEPGDGELAAGPSRNFQVSAASRFARPSAFSAVRSPAHWA